MSKPNDQPPILLWLPDEHSQYRLVLGATELARVCPAPDHVDNGWWGIMDDYLEHSPTSEAAKAKIDKKLYAAVLAHCMQA